MTILHALRSASLANVAYPLVCPCSGEVELAGPGFRGAVRCQSCGAVHASLATLVRKDGGK